MRAVITLNNYLLPQNIFIISFLLFPEFTLIHAESNESAGDTVTTVQSSPSLPDLSFHPVLPKPVVRPVFTSIHSGERHVYQYYFNESLINQFPAFQLQFYAETDQILDTSEDAILNVIVTWNSRVRSWEVPINQLDSSSEIGKVHRFSDNVVAKTIWLHPELNSGASCNLTVEVRVSTMIHAQVYYKVKIVVLKDFMVQPTLPVSTFCTPSAPAIYKFNIPPRWEHIFLHVVSETDNCALMTLEQPEGPFLELDGRNPTGTHFSQTFTMKAGFTLRSADFPNGFLLKFLPFASDIKCRKQPTFEHQRSNSFRKKAVSFQIREGTTPSKFLTSLASPIILFLGIAIAAFFIMCMFHNHRYRCNNRDAVLNRKGSKYHSNITMKDVTISEPSQIAGKSNRYCAAGFVTSFFYSVPVFQLILTFGRQLFSTGDFDLCYFNHFCAHMYLRFYDFNHVYSNIWYVLFGILFMILVKLRQVTNVPIPENHVKQEDNPAGVLRGWVAKIYKRPNTGTMTNYGLLFCMGYALIMTGVMSAVYHICPNQNNFQFDTVFMYTIAAVSVVTLYQARHPTYLSAIFTFSALGMVASFTVLGLLWDSFYARVCFSTLHLGFLLLTLPKVYYNGYVKNGDKVIMHWMEMMTILCCKLSDDWRQGRMLQLQRDTWYSPHDRNIVVLPGHGRLFLPGFLCLNNCIAIFSMWTVFVNQNFATQVLFICVFNGAMYLLYYTVLKLYHGECRSVMWVQPFIYLVLSFCLWGLAMVYFLTEVATWEASPAESRLLNADCVFLSFYDSHDLWHFLSASALFCSAMVLLTVDDDLLDQSHDNIPVF